MQYAKKSFFKYAGIQIRPVEWNNSLPHIRAKYREKYFNYWNFSAPNPDSALIPEDPAITREKNLNKNPDALLRFINSINPLTCKM